MNIKKRHDEYLTEYIISMLTGFPDQPGPLFHPDEIEPSMLSFRIPLFGDPAPCSVVLDGTFGRFYPIFICSPGILDITFFRMLSNKV
jgi:hypothetical protein